MYAVIIDNFLPFIILLVCNVIIICKMQQVMKSRTQKLNIETQKNVYGVLPMMLGKPVCFMYGFGKEYVKVLLYHAYLLT